MDPGRRVEHLLLYGCGRLEHPLDFANHVTDVIIHPFHLDCGTGPGEGIHDLFSAPRNGNAGSIPGARSVLILRLLGIHAGADVYVNRHMGWQKTHLCGDQVLSIHHGGIHPDASGNPVAGYI